ncbi:unnamed protein product [Parascedosporium putredinis]|uniref:STI1 domain-containing protein n=1 Tax=Parascedosporium putredinis TaxID=1442378 RepID=A0A9P1HB75_9PEZI|nr:unnamed protein product [Parascedosporium putredinis]CAI8001866.1 unnamed protein product [Parascedosporium putredinis]
MASADELKTKGNQAIAAKNFDEAIDFFTQAIAIQPENHILYSNRSAAHASKKDWKHALADAEKTTQLKPDWGKGWGRKGAALHGNGDLLGAADAYEEGLKIDPNNAQLKSGLDSVQKAIETDGGDPGAGLANMFSDPNLIQKLASNPKTSAYLADPAFMQKINQFRENPKNAQDIFNDPRMIQVLGPEEEDEEALEKKKAKEAAEKEKALGTENYKKRNFDDAIKHYSKAWELHQDITYLNNLGAAYFEKGDYQACVDACTKAVEEGRRLREVGRPPLAIQNYQKSLTEHRVPDVLNKLKAAERNKIESARLAYIDPQKAEEAREEGNKKFKETDWPGAVAAYSEMIKRSPDDPRGYSNRAAAFLKLFELPSALDDCETAIKKDPKFIRAYIRKAQVYHGMREYSKAVDASYAAMYSARENESEEQTRERLQRDPEIMSVMQDPVMQSILQQAQSDPAALAEHMKNPGVRSKIQKLVAAGVIRVGR